MSKMADMLKSIDDVVEELVSYREEQAVKELKDQVIALIQEYDAREDKRDAAIQSFLNEDGDLNEDEYTWSEYDEVVDDSAHEAREDLAGLLNSLRELVGLPAYA